MSEPIVFEPLFMERVWGGRRLETRYGKRLPPGARVGESWEIVDREEAQSVVHDGPFRGSTLHDLWTEHRDTLFGTGFADIARFPLLFKILDAQERLSMQVHPPAEVAARIGGESKTEMWHILETLTGAAIYAGLRNGVTRDDFSAALADSHIADRVHRIPTHAGDTMFIPSGRIHAIGAGNLIFEVQQNSDTTYRVFDWNRIGLDGAPRPLHIAESLASIDFADHEPTMLQPSGETIAHCEHFHVEKWHLDAPRSSGGETFAVIMILSGEVECCQRRFTAGRFLLLPADCPDRELTPRATGTTLLRTTIPRPS